MHDRSVSQGNSVLFTHKKKKVILELKFKERKKKTNVFFIKINKLLVQVKYIL